MGHPSFPFAYFVPCSARSPASSRPRLCNLVSLSMPVRAIYCHIVYLNLISKQLFSQLGANLKIDWGTPFQVFTTGILDDETYHVDFC